TTLLDALSGRGPVYRILGRFDSIGKNKTRARIPGPTVRCFVVGSIVPGTACLADRSPPDLQVSPFRPARPPQAVSVQLTARPNDRRHTRLARFMEGYVDRVREDGMDMHDVDVAKQPTCGAAEAGGVRDPIGTEYFQLMHFNERLQIHRLLAAPSTLVG